MAFSMRLSCMGKDGSDLLRMEFDWWNISALGKHVKLTWTSANDTSSYGGEDADISADALRIIHE